MEPSFAGGSNNFSLKHSNAQWKLLSTIDAHTTVSASIGADCKIKTPSRCSVKVAEFRVSRFQGSIPLRQQCLSHQSFDRLPNRTQSNTLSQNVNSVVRHLWSRRSGPKFPGPHTTFETRRNSRHVLMADRWWFVKKKTQGHQGTQKGSVNTGKGLSIHICPPPSSIGSPVQIDDCRSLTLSRHAILESPMHRSRRIRPMRPALRG
jgi:hypothetical protein